LPPTTLQHAIYTLSLHDALPISKIEQQRLDALKRLRPATDHDGELSLLDREDASRHRRVNHVSARFANSSRKSAGDGGTGGAHVDPHFTRTESLDDAVRTFSNSGERFGVRHH